MSGTIGKIAKELLATIPGGLEVALISRDVIVPLPSSFHPGKAFHSWLRDLRGLKGFGFTPPTNKTNKLEERSVLFFSYLPHWLNISLAMTVVLMARKCRLDFAFLPYTRHDRPDLSSDAKQAWVNYWRFMKSSDPQLRFINLMHLELEAVRPSPHMVEAAKEQAILDTKYILQREEIEEIEVGKGTNHMDHTGHTGHTETFEFCFRRNLDCMTRLASLLHLNDYDVMLIPNGGSMAFGAAFRLARLMGQKVTCFEFGERLGTIIISADMPCTDMDTSKEWNQDFPHVLSATAVDRIKDLISTRQRTYWEGFLYTSQKSPYEGNKEQILSRVKVSQDNRRLVLLCLNVAWDSALLGRDCAFKSLVEWVRQTVTYFSRRKDSWLIVRIHPAETMIGTGQPLANVIQESCPHLPDQVRVVSPDDPVNTYDLMDICDFGLAYNSTTGLEMAMRGIPVIVAGRPHYVGKGFTIDVETPEKYFMAIDQMLAKPKGHRLSSRQIELAWCYADVYFFHWPKPFPWCLGTFWEDMERWPIERVLSEEGQTQFGRSFDLLVGR